MNVYGKTSEPSPPELPPARFATSARLAAFLAGAIFIIVLVVVLGVWRTVDDQLQRAALSRFEWRAAQTTVDLRNRLGACEEILRGAGGLFDVAPLVASTPADSSAARVTADVWQRYVWSLELDQKQPAVRALGYAAAGADGVLRLAGDIKADGTPDDKSAKSARVPVTLMVPARPGTAPLAYDLGSDPSRRGALLRASDTGHPALVARPAPFDARTDPDRARFELYLPVYRTAQVPKTKEARRASVTGFVIAYVDAEWLLASLDVHDRNIDWQVYSGGSPANLLYASSDEIGEPESPLFSRTETLRVGGEPLTLIYTMDDRNLGTGDALASATILILGVLVSALTAVLVFLLVREQAKS